MATNQEPEQGFGPAVVAVAILAPLAVSGVLLVFRDQLFTPNAALVLVLAVLAAAVIGGRWGGALSALVAALCFDFFFTRPYYSFTINRRHDVETTLILLVVGLVVGEIVTRARRTPTARERTSPRDRPDPSRRRARGGQRSRGASHHDRRA